MRIEQGTMERQSCCLQTRTEPKSYRIAVPCIEPAAQEDSRYSDYDATYATSADRISPLWHIA